MTAPVRRCLGAALLCAVLSVLCIVLIDQPVERLVIAHPGPRPLFQLMAGPSLLPLPLACLYLAVCAFRKATAGPAPNGMWLRISLATIVADAAKDQLKWMIGRPWPQYWVKYGLYTFHPFDTSFLYGSFPSGHTAYIAAPMMVLWWLAPPFRVVWGGMIVLVMVGLIGAGYHYVADAIAGFFVGLAAASGTLAWLGTRDG